MSLRSVSRRRRSHEVDGWSTIISQRSHGRSVRSPSAGEGKTDGIADGTVPAMERIDSRGECGQRMTIRTMLARQDIRRAAFSAIIAVVVFVAYWPALGAAFIGDDYDALCRAMTWHGLVPTLETAVNGAFYRPGQEALMKLLYELFGANPIPYRIVQVILHLCIAAVLVVLGEKLLRDAGLVASLSSRAAWIGGSVFALMPRLDEGVAWISAIQTPAATLGILVAVYGMFMPKRKPFLRILCVVTGMVGSLTMKETAVVLPIYALATSIVISGDTFTVRFRKALREPTVIATAATAVLFLLARWVILGGVGGYGLRTSDGGLGHIAGIAAVNLVRYPLTALTVPASIITLLPSTPVVVLSAAIIAVLSASAWLVAPHLSKHEKETHAPVTAPKVALFILAVYFVVSMLPTLHLIPSMTGNGGGRYVYTPSVWLALAVGLILARLSVRWRMGVTVGILATYAVLGRWSSIGFLRAGAVCDRLVRTYVDFCGAHPSVQPYVVMTSSSVGGYNTLGGLGLQAAVKFCGAPVARPNIPPISISPFWSDEEAVMSRDDSATFRATMTRTFSRADCIVFEENAPDVTSATRLSPKEVRISSPRFVPAVGRALLVARNSGYVEIP